MKKLLIANRGEIAVRVIRTAKEMGIKTVAIHSEVDSDALHTKIADESVCVGGNRAKDSYLNMPAILSAAEVTGADSIHPGYGFLSENSEFAKLIEECGLTYVGPSSESIRALGSKVESREVAKKAKIPLLPGSGIIENVKEAKKFAEQIGYPVLIKASNGGGGRGMRVVLDPSEFESTFRSAQNESKAAFGSPDVFIEKFIEKPKHIEIQIAADKHGKIIHFGERECSVQRRHQKIIEEAPAPFFNQKQRDDLGALACQLARDANYVGVGTVEFLMDEDQSLYFMEMNSRLQVEHPVTEEVYGIDLVKIQIDIADGKKLKFEQAEIKPVGHAIECRINAEDPVNFIPSPGKIETYIAPGGRRVRIDSGVYSGSKVSPFYDSMLAKLICWSDSRPNTIKTLKRALNEYIIDGIKTNIPLHLDIVSSKDFKGSLHYTRWIEEVFLKKKIKKIKSSEQINSGIDAK